MFYPILLSAIAAASFGVPAQAPDPTIRITLNNEGQYLPGDRAKVQVITRDDGYLVVFRVSPEGKLRVLFPLDPTDDNYVKGGKRYLLLGRGGREGFTVDGGGTGVIFAAVSLDPWRYSAYVQNDHWDYGALNTVTYEDTETDLVNLAQAMASGRFDYDILGYTVASQQVAAAEEQVDAGASAGASTPASAASACRWAWSTAPATTTPMVSTTPGTTRRTTTTGRTTRRGAMARRGAGSGAGAATATTATAAAIRNVLPAVSHGGAVLALPEEVVGSHLERLAAALSPAGREHLHRDEYRLGSVAGDRRAAARELPRPHLGRTVPVASWPARRW